MLDLLAEVVGGSISHLADDEGTNLRWRVFLASGHNPSIAVGVSDDLVRDVGDVLLDLGVLELSADQTGESQLEYRKKRY